jgi:hypothetical protein
MRIDPQVLALRGNLSPQRDARGKALAALEDWRSQQFELLDEFAEFGRGRPLAACPMLAERIADQTAAMALVEALVGSMLEALREEPLGQVPLRQFSGNGVSSLLLAREGRAMLLLSAREEGCEERGAVTFSDGERHELVLAGRADARFVRSSSAGPEVAKLATSRVPLEARKTISLDQSHEALMVHRVTRRLLTLRLVRSAEVPRPTREYRLADGAFLHQASGDVRESRHELMLALLGRMGRQDAASTMAEMALEGSEHIRWQALRECLALDTAAGFRVLSRIACDLSDPLAGPSGALRAQLLEAHPVLAQLENA